jgi:rare lipoprotein A
MTARRRGLRSLALATGVLMTGAAAALPSAAHGQDQTGAATAAPAEKVTVSVKRHQLAGKRIKFGGKLESGAAGRSVLIQQRSGKSWKTVASTQTRDGGRFSAYWRPSKAGRVAIRAFVRGDAGAAPAVRQLRGGITVYVPRMASWYGPGLYGNKLACGGRLSPGTVGVAHKTLPCGTKITLHLRGRTVQTKVIDRGPYVGGRVYDLTAATKQKLGFGSTGTVWATR